MIRRVFIPIFLALSFAAAAHAQEGTWRVRLGVMPMDAFGHDQHVLTVHEIERGAGVNIKTAVTLDTEEEVAYHADFNYSRGQWTWGASFFLFTTSQVAPEQTAAAGGSIDEVVFEIADRQHTSSGPGEVLFFRILEDTDLAAWTFDLYGMRTLAESNGNALRLQLGVRSADFDNDYRAVVGIEGVGGTRLDASSNYPRMTGPLIGLSGNFQRGRNSIEGHIAQSVIFGSADLSTMAREFTGPPSESLAVVSQRTFRKVQDVAIPMTDLRIQWNYRVSRLFSFGIGARASTWWDVPVPPGIIPGVGGDQVLHENTIVFFGLSGGIELTF